MKNKSIEEIRKIFSECNCEKYIEIIEKVDCLKSKGKISAEKALEYREKILGRMQIAKFMHTVNDWAAWASKYSYKGYLDINYFNSETIHEWKYSDIEQITRVRESGMAKGRKYAVGLGLLNKDYHKDLLVTRPLYLPLKDDEKPDKGYAFNRRVYSIDWRNEQFVYVYKGALINELKSRRYTIDSVYYDFRRKRTIDPFHGRSDYALKLVRLINAKARLSCEDITRGIEVALFTGFDIEPETMKAFQKRAHLFAKLPKKQLIDLFDSLMELNRPRTITLFKEIGILDFIMKGYDDLCLELLDENQEKVCPYLVYFAYLIRFRNAVIDKDILTFMGGADIEKLVAMPMPELTREGIRSWYFQYGEKADLFLQMMDYEMPGYARKVESAARMYQADRMMIMLRWAKYVDYKELAGEKRASEVRESVMKEIFDGAILFESRNNFKKYLSVRYKT